jgi:hypothetical protein
VKNKNIYFYRYYIDIYNYNIKNTNGNYYYKKQKKSKKLKNQDYIDIVPCISNGNYDKNIIDKDYKFTNNKISIQKWHLIKTIYNTCEYNNIKTFIS